MRFFENIGFRIDGFEYAHEPLKVQRLCRSSSRCGAGKEALDPVGKLLGIIPKYQRMLDAGHDPQFRPGVRLVERLQMAEPDVGVGRSVDEQDRRGATGNRILWPHGLKIEPMYHASFQERAFDGGTKHGFCQPRTGAELAAHAIVGRLAKISEPGLGHHRAETMLDLQ